MHQNQNKHQLHMPVLLDEVLEYLAPQPNESYLDLTAGYGGHAAAMLARTNRPDRAVLVDRDAYAIQELAQRFGQDIDLRQNDFYRASEELAAESRAFDCILADLGVSSPHLNEGNRGFSLKAEGPLDMRMDQDQALTAAAIVNTWDEQALAQILHDYGEEPKARQIAHLIVGNRPFSSTTQLANVVAKAWPGHSRVHPATRSFQALRIAVNDELGQLERSLPLWQGLLAPGGRLAVISFHSLEDRIVKRYFAERAGNRYDDELRLLTKRPITATPQELVLNPRSRSAKLRVVANKQQKERSAHADSG
jgi:16S rRNA (cytosine1402-N4)-methyltransferase